MIKTDCVHPATNIRIFSTPEMASQQAARQIADVILAKQKTGEQAVLGLATGNTPKKVYFELVRMHQNEGLSFKNVVSFNLDEYYLLTPEHPLSYHRFMKTHLFGHVDILPENIHLPFGTWEKEKLQHHCTEYEEKIKQYGGLDLQLLGIGRNGHIGFNEPGSNFDSTTRLVNLHSLTRLDAEADFGTMEMVPHQAISIGIHTITQAKKILLLALGERKSEIINKALKGDVSTDVPASILQTIPQVEIVLDAEAASLIQD